jgi:coenzyme F420-reducing hydrogenase alpha subunit
VEVLGGRAVHPTAPTVGGFLSVPDKATLKKLVEDLEAHLHLALETVEMFAGFKYPTLTRETEYLAIQKEGKLAYYGADRIVSNRGLSSTIENYPYAFKEEVRTDSPTKYGTRDGHGFMVGALARLSLDSNSLHAKAAYAMNEIWGKKLPTYNSFHNNVAQAIEVVHLIEESIDCLKEVIADRNEIYKVPFKAKAGIGVGAIEAPRGTLYHGIKTDENGDIILYDIVTPTVQNLVNLEEDADALLKLHKGENQDKLYKEVEMLIRAYDPCITCSVH